jgi:ubiquinone/menaquinone biosynthesis C-methylase UbiE
MSRPDFLSSYREQLGRLLESEGVASAMELIVGGRFAETGILEKDCLIHLGLEPPHTLVDIGCGSGRLPLQLRHYLTGRFIGTDILPEALDYARKICGRPDWKFIPCSDCVIPCADGSADVVTFFSVFTHLLDEDIFRYLREARRVVRPSGKVVFSFLDFDCDAHWDCFEKTVADRNPNRVLNKFLTKHTARRLARGAGFIVDVIYDGSEKWIPAIGDQDISNSLPPTPLFEFGQSVAVLRPFPEARYLTQYPDVAACVVNGGFISGAHHYDVCGFREGRTA